jgi:hypothetical protein
VELLQDAVAGGASIGFVLPLERGEVEAYWQNVAADLRQGVSRCLPPSSMTDRSARSSSAWSRGPTAGTAPKS